MKLLSLLQVGLLLWVSPLRAASDYLLEIDGIKGESVDETRKEAIEISSFSWGVSNPVALSTGGGGATGKANFQDLHFTKRIDKASPLLMLHCATGTHIASATFVVRKTSSDGTKPLEYYKITLSDILVTGITNEGNSGDDRPTESFSLNYAKIKVEYFPVGADGRLGTAVVFNWDVKANVRI